MRLYIAGPMTGIENYNFDAFNRTSVALSANGHEVYNPATTFRGRQDLPYDMYLREAVRLISNVEGVVLLPDWHLSRGALTEVHIGLSIEVPFFIEDVGELAEYAIDYGKLTEAMVAKYGDPITASNFYFQNRYITRLPNPNDAPRDKGPYLAAV